MDRRNCRTIRQLDVLNWDLCPDALDTESASITVAGGDVPGTYAGNLLLLDSTLYCVGTVAPGNCNTKLTLLLPDTLFDRDLIYTEPQIVPTSCGEFLVDRITAEWILQPDPDYALPYVTVANSDTTLFVAPEPDENGVYSFLSYIRNLRRRFGVVLRFALSRSGITVTIRRASPRQHTLIHKDGHTLVEALTWTSSGVAKITTIQPIDTGEVDEDEQKIYRTEIRDWYLAADGSVSEQIPEHRAEGTWEKLPVSEKDDPEEKATERFEQAKRSDHKIELRTDVSMAVGDGFRLRYAGAVYEGTISCIRKKSGESRCLYRSGDFATTLTEKVRSSLRKE